MLTKARAFAVQAHGDQKYGDRPYSFHLDMVANNLAAYGEQAQVIGYLHDVVEDTSVTKDKIEEEFGSLVAECVGLLTDEPGANRKERKAKTYEKLSRVSGQSELALVVKVADRLANVTACVADGKRSLWEVYLSEQAAFKKAAYRAGLCDQLWADLESQLQEGALDRRV
ncbi:HD domain-containing protein [Viridibacterium curvum]|uniref:Bifunctional (P)ppGpp synthetase/guanosine-3',5'-bis(Diphosphate) 3'-pyrophosphohydrolase n=1 Tax=Viridibacterium curvum TaxID=1101404 RepID=A0ABP9R907_9RHOO